MTALYIALAVIGGLFLLAQAGSIALAYWGVGDYPDWLQNMTFLSADGSWLRRTLQR